MTASTDGASSASSKIERQYAPVEVAHLMNVDVRTVLAWLRNENHPLNGVKHANMWRIPESNLAKFLSGEYYGN